MVHVDQRDPLGCVIAQPIRANHWSRTSTDGLIRQMRRNVLLTARLIGALAGSDSIDTCFE